MSEFKIKGPSNNLRINYTWTKPKEGRMGGGEDGWGGGVGEGKMKTSVLEHQ